MSYVTVDLTSTSSAHFRGQKPRPWVVFELVTATGKEEDLTVVPVSFLRGKKYGSTTTPVTIV